MFPLFSLFLSLFKMIHAWPLKQKRIVGEAICYLCNWGRAVLDPGTVLYVVFCTHFLSELWKQCRAAWFLVEETILRVCHKHEASFCNNFSISSESIHVTQCQFLFPYFSGTSELNSKKLWQKCQPGLNVLAALVTSLLAKISFSAPDKPKDWKAKQDQTK